MPIEEIILVRKRFVHCKPIYVQKFKPNGDWYLDHISDHYTTRYIITSNVPLVRGEFISVDNLFKHSLMLLVTQEMPYQIGNEFVYACSDKKDTIFNSITIMKYHLGELAI